MTERAEADNVTPLDPELARTYAAGSVRLAYAGVPDDPRYFPESAAEGRRRRLRAQAKWRESDAYKHASKVQDVLVRVGAGVFALSLAGAFAIWALDLNLRFATASAACGLVVLVVCLILARHTMRSVSGDYVPDEEDAPQQQTKSPSKWLQDPDLQNLITLNRTQMQVYHELATKQATSASRNSRRAMLVGFLLLVVGGVVAIQADDEGSKVVVGALAGLGSLLSGYIGRTFLKAEDRAMQQLNFYFQQPLVTSYMLAAERLTLKLANSRRDTVLTDVIKQVLGAARTAEVASATKTSPRRGTTRGLAPSAPAKPLVSSGPERQP